MCACGGCVHACTHTYTQAKKEPSLWRPSLFQEGETGQSRESVQKKGMLRPALRDVLLPWGAMDVPHHTFHHPLNAFVHSFAEETENTGYRSLISGSPPSFAIPSPAWVSYAILDSGPFAFKGCREARLMRGLRHAFDPSPPALPPSWHPSQGISVWPFFPDHVAKMKSRLASFDG